ncbi:transporter substrate-binding domain-containing protein [Alkalibacterium iburiense]|uniref:Transporter substrate-binding domain-containing protein n=1 Tax=Alkalibacterium iburiense TaxID=290589 RepID=A0ABP3HGA7_9LACT
MKNRKRLWWIAVLMLGTFFLKGCGTEASTPAADQTNRLEDILERGYIEVATEPYFAPNQFIDPSKDGDEQYVGSDIELSQYIADELGVELRVVPLEFSAVLSSITEGKYDLAISALAYTPARAEAMLLSDGYYFSENSPGYGLLIREEHLEDIYGPEDLDDKTVVVQSGSIQEALAMEQIPEYQEMKRVSSTNDGMLMVQENKADAAVISVSMAQLNIDANKNSGLTIVEDFEFEVDDELGGTRIGMSLGEEELAEKINTIIDDVVSSGIYEEWYEEYAEYAKSLGL